MTDNPLLTESGLPYGAPQFDKIRNEHYLPAFREAINEAKAEIDAIVSSPELPTFANTIEALEYSGKTLGHVSDIFSTFWKPMRMTNFSRLRKKCRR